MQRIGRTIVRRLLITSTFARLYVCWDPGLEREVVAKVFTLDPETDHPPLSWTEWRERFLREGRILAGLDHVNVVRVLEAGLLSNGSPYMMLPFHALTLTNLIGYDHTHPLPEDAAMRAPPCALAPAQALPLLAQVMRGLAYLHENGIVHRDIKPSNILLTARIKGIARLCDFGVAKVGDEPDLAKGTWIGSRDYVSPEQKRDCGRVTGAADVYAAAVMGYRMLTGRRPRADGERPSVVGVPERINRVLARSLDEDAAARPTALEFLRVLTQ